MIKDLLPKQVVCNQTGIKGKPCHGGLKRYHPFSSYYNEEDSTVLHKIELEFGKRRDLVLLKCENCGVVYRLPSVLHEKYGG